MNLTDAQDIRVWRSVLFAIHEAENIGVDFTPLLWYNGRAYDARCWLH